jgi:signal transduction histidine kinase
MISTLLKTIDRGMHVMRSNSRLLLVGILLFVFPLLFIWITQSFFSTAQSNIVSSEKQKVGVLHDALAISSQDSLKSDILVPQLIARFIEQNDDVTKIRVVEMAADGVLIRYSFNESEIDSYVESDELFKNLPLANTQEVFIYPAVIDGVRTWQVFSGVETQGKRLVVFTEHSFQMIDSVMLARQQKSYLGLTGIFLFLIALAYWLNRQTQWEKQHDTLAKKIVERDLFTNMIAHEFRTPLTAIKGYASFLEESDELSPDNKRFATNVRISAERLVLLVSDFLEVARLQSGKIQISKERIDISEVLQPAVDDLQIVAKNKDLQLVYKTPFEPIFLKTDKARLTQVVINLVSNAIKYTEFGVIEIECERTVTAVILRIKDSGSGISAEDQKKLFTPFTRVGGVDGQSVPGTGLGMWITQQLLVLLDADIAVESIHAVGTHVIVTFNT